MTVVKKQKQDMNMMKLMEAFDTDAECRATLVGLRWPDGLACLRCGSTRIRNSYTRNQYDCGDCGYQFSVTTGTIFHDTKLPLPKWFVAVYLMTESKKGISANQMKRTISVSYETAWYLCHRIRAAMNETGKQLTGTVEVDETYVGGKVRGKGKGYVQNKAIVVGAIQRRGGLVLKVIESNNKKTLHGFIRENVSPDAEAIYTDEHPSYIGVGTTVTRHESIQHRAEEWARGDVSTNGIENVWSLFKRSVVGSYHHLSEKHLDAYLDELEWRFGNRENPYLFRDTLVRLVRAPSLGFANLVSGASPSQPKHRSP